MQCPACEQTTLVMSERQGIEIDYCPKCRGVWLDRGELDKLIERSLMAESPSDPAYSPSRHLSSDRYPGYPPREYIDDDDYRRKRKKSIWREIFDFD
ncbi:MAG: hypothetical protein AMXMBFR84_49320 [Candidatus Hydrogenedentota bacterium]